MRTERRVLSHPESDRVAFSPVEKNTTGYKHKSSKFKEQKHENIQLKADSLHLSAPLFLNTVSTICYE